MKAIDGTCQDFLLNLNWKNTPINYEWNNDILCNISNTGDGHLRLKKALNKMGYRASIVFAACLLKFVLIRFDGHPELSREFIDDVNNRIDSVFAASINALYSPILKYGINCKVPSEGHVHGPCSVILRKIMFVSIEYNKRGYYIHRHLVGPVLLLEHIAPNKKLFNEWLTNIIRKVVDAFPCRYNYDDGLNQDDVYDYSDEPLVPLEFFIEESFLYSHEIAKQNISTFLQSLDCSTNPYLRTPEEMLEAGFKGVPYVL